MARLETNRDLYLAINELTDRRENKKRGDLEEYLRALLRECRSRRDAAVLTMEEFMAVLARAFVAEPLPYDPTWAAAGYPELTDDRRGFSALEATILRQIVDLREMREAGTLDYEYRGLGVLAPRGGSWYNFEPPQYLECAAEGTFGGWEPGDPTGRTFVSGLAAVAGEDGGIELVDPSEVERPVHRIGEVDWETFADFLFSGQNYE